ncbi:MAG: hypothetical protein EA365_06375 [Gloeocapsa sp. DLM2.Bin57]|nr:MAG: hypothetical protein EA365_06375 [Gloeocapsa sp. DLM2.Bin57]
MPARDYYHDVVKKALEKNGWTITHDPYPIKLARGKNLVVDLDKIIRLFTFNVNQTEIVTWIP